MNHPLIPSILIAAALGCGALTPLARADDAGTPALPAAAASFTDDQKAIVGAALLGLTPDVLAAAGLSPAQVAEIQSAVSSANVFDALIAEAVQVDQERSGQAATTQDPPQSVAPQAVAPVQTASAAHSSLLGPLTSVALMSLLTTASSDLSSSTLHSFSASFFSTGTSSSRNMASSSAAKPRIKNPAASSADTAKAKAAPQHHSLEQLQTTLRASCLKSLPSEHIARVEKCIHAVRNGLPPEYASACRTQQDRGLLRAALAAERQAKLLGQPLEQEDSDLLQAVRSKPAVIDARVSKRANIAAIRTILSVQDRTDPSDEN